MTESNDIDPEAKGRTSEKPCVALMGEFSAGKSTLTNLLIGAKSLPVQVTATQLPPVWISNGEQPPYRVDLDGNVLPVDFNDLGSIEVVDTAYIRIFRRSPTLEVCDIIDMPGISDPSMAADVWQRVIHHATSVVWCTHATQAWRQSEAAVWEHLPPALYEKSLLLLTRMDKITSEKDRTRLLRRVRHEADTLFADVLPISLLQALEAGDDAAAFEASGATAFLDRLSEVISGETAAGPSQSNGDVPRAELGLVETVARNAPEPDDASTVAAGTILPKRVTPRTGLRATSRRGDRPAARAANAG